MKLVFRPVIMAVYGVRAAQGGEVYGTEQDNEVDGHSNLTLT